MSKRIVLVDNKKVNPTQLFGIGLGTDIYSLDSFIDPATGVVNPKELDKILLGLGHGDGIMTVGPDAFKEVKARYHMGIRNENYADVALLQRLSMAGGAYLIQTLEVPSAGQIGWFMSDQFSSHRDLSSRYRHKVLGTYQEVSGFLAWLESLPADEFLGFDYETSGMALDPVFYVSGVSLCNLSFGGFISFSDLRRNEGPSRIAEISDRLGKFLASRMDHLVVYNMQFEFQVSHREFGVDLYDLLDAAVINVLDGYHLKRFSLKWTAQRVLGVQAWDTEFDLLSDLMDSMFYMTVGKGKSAEKILKVTLSNYQDTPEWHRICQLYPAHVGEFEMLIREYWGLPFMCIPSSILGHYCNLDSYYTLLMFETKRPEYSQDAWQTFLDNSRLACRLHSSGLYVDEDFRKMYAQKCLDMMAWGITYCAAVRCKIRMEEVQTKMADISKFHPVCQILIRDGHFYSGDPLEITKEMLARYVDPHDIYETGLDEGALMMHYGEDFATFLAEKLEARMKEIKFKGKIDAGIVRKKKLLGLLAEDLKGFLGLGKIKPGPKLDALEDYKKLESTYTELMRIYQTEMPDIEHIPETFNAFGRSMSSQEYSDFVSKNYFQCKSPEQNDQIVSEMFQLFRSETTYIGALSGCIQQLDGEEKFYSTRGLLDPSTGFPHFMNSWQRYDQALKSGQTPEQAVVGLDYPQKMFDLAYEIWGVGDDLVSKKRNPTNALDCPPGKIVKDVWTNFEGFTTQSGFFGGVKDQYILYGFPWSDSDLSDRFYFMRKFTLSYLLYKKYAKVLSTYIDGMFKAKNRYVIEGPDRIPLRYADPSEPGAVEKCFVHYEVNTKSSKRWSSGFHTIISHSDLKDVICAPSDDTMLTYFDISSAEVKTLPSMVVIP